KVVAEVVGEEGADDADQDDCEPVDARDVLVLAKLDDEHAYEQDAHDHGGAVEAEAELVVQEVSERLADGGAEDLDDPEVEGDLGDLVEHLPATEGAALRC